MVPGFHPEITSKILPRLPLKTRVQTGLLLQRFPKIWWQRILFLFTKSVSFVGLSLRGMLLLVVLVMVLVHTRKDFLFSQRIQIFGIFRW